jgi:hypothetical protein
MHVSQYYLTTTCPLAHLGTGSLYDYVGKKQFIILFYNLNELNHGILHSGHIETLEQPSRG